MTDKPTIDQLIEWHNYATLRLKPSRPTVEYVDVKVVKETDGADITLNLGSLMRVHDIDPASVELDETLIDIEAFSGYNDYYGESGEPSIEYKIYFRRKHPPSKELLERYEADLREWEKEKIEHERKGSLLRESANQIQAELKMREVRKLREQARYLSKQAKALLKDGCFPDDAIE